MNIKRITETFSRYQSLIQAEIKKISGKKNIKIIIAAVAGCIVLSFVFVIASGSDVYCLTIDGKNAGYITDKSIVGDAIQEVKAAYSSGKTGLDVSINQDAIAYKPTDLKKDDVTALNLNDVKKKIAASDICTAKGWTIRVDGKNLVAVKSQGAAKKILADVKNHYLTSGSKVLGSSFKENVIVTESAVGIADFMEPDQAEALILTGQKTPKTYTVKDGDTLWGIATANEMSIAELQSANPGFDPNKLKIGQQLNLVAMKPYVTVETKELITATEKIDFNTVYEDTNTLYNGEVKIKTPGVCGSKQVSSEVSKENGVVVGTNVVSSVVTAQPQNQVALKGTKAKALYVASRGGGRSFSIEATGSEIVAYAKKFLGTPYSHGGSSPDGFDCSGFTQYVYSHFGGSLPRTAASQYSCGNFVDKSSLQPGDLVFFAPSSKSSHISHVGIYVGGGSFIHAPQTGERVKITSFSVCNLKYCGAVRAE